MPTRKLCEIDLFGISPAGFLPFEAAFGVKVPRRAQRGRFADDRAAAGNVGEMSGLRLCETQPDVDLDSAGSLSGSRSATRRRSGLARLPWRLKSRDVFHRLSQSGRAGATPMAKRIAAPE